MTPSDNAKVLATASITLDELPGMEINTVSILPAREVKPGAKGEGKIRVLLSPPFASTAFRPQSEPLFTKSGDVAGFAVTAEGKAAAEDLATRILHLFEAHGADGETYGL